MSKNILTPTLLSREFIWTLSISKVEWSDQGVIFTIANYFHIAYKEFTPVLHRIKSPWGNATLSIFGNEERIRNQVSSSSNESSQVLNLDHIHKSTRMFGVGGVATVDSIWEQEKEYEISGFHPAAMDRAKF